ncbi:MAG: CPBP family intramembrane metalloprotease [Saccharofermentans sp.]|nr:CPBP family intramembrane metalloprotease [Saccharofermentans sp.]
MDSSSRKISLLYILLGIAPFPVGIAFIYIAQLVIFVAGFVDASIEGITDSIFVLDHAITFLNDNVIYALCLYAVICVVLFIVLDRKIFTGDKPVSRLGIRDISGILIIAVASNIACLGILYLFEVLTPSLYQDYISFLDDGALGDIGVATIVYGVLLAPVVEELAFRGISYKAFRKSGLSLPLVILLQAFLFGLFHLNVVQSTYTFFMGIVFGLVRYKTGNLTASVIAHIAFNLWGVFGQAILSLMDERLLAVLIVLSVFVAAASYRFILKDNRERKADI